MKKLPILIIFLLILSVNVFAGGMHEHNGKNYFVSIIGGAYALAFSNKSLEEDVLIDLKEAIYQNRFHFFGLIASNNRNEILRRGYFQNGDKFLLHDDFPNILATYIGQRRNIRNTFLEEKEGLCWGFGFSISGGEIFIEELILTQEEYDLLNID